jgi:hypothetical protein
MTALPGPDARNPVQIRSGMDGSQVELLVQAPAPRLWGIVVFGLALAGLFALWNVWIGLVTAFLALAALRRPKAMVPTVLRLEVDRGGVTYRGKRVEADCDYFGVTLDGTHHVVVGGLTKREHEQLRALFFRGDPGSAEDVPKQLEVLASRERDP